MRSFVLILLVLVGTAFHPAFGQIDNSKSLRNRYFMVVWGYEGKGNLPRESHTFVSFYSGEDLADGRVKPATISWLPADGTVSLMGTERGRNFSLSETLAMACQAGRSVASWGPYEVSLDLYRQALARIRLLDSGSVAYNALGAGSGSMNCIEAAGDITAAPFHPGVSWGFRASESVIRHLAPLFKVGLRIDASVAQMMVSEKCGSTNEIVTSR
jgi:hypothetical protein